MIEFFELPTSFIFRRVSIVYDQRDLILPRYTNFKI